MNKFLQEVLEGELSTPAPRRPGRLTRLPQRVLTLHADERGMLSLVSMVTMLFFLILIAMLTNIGRAINLKIDAQNAADAAAYSAAVEQARSMNAVTATNHLMGELLSFVVIHRAIGGPELEANKGLISQDFPLNIMAADFYVQLPIQHYAAKAEMIAGNLAALQSPTTLEPFAYNNGLSDSINTGATTRDGKVRLKIALEIALGMKMVAGPMIACKLIPIIGPAIYAAGMALAAAAEAMEALIVAEWKVLDLMEKVAKNGAMIKIRDVFYTWLLPNAYNYLQFIESTSGPQAARAAAAIAEMNGFKCSTMDTSLLLGIPVKPENFPGSADYKAEAFGFGNASLLEGVVPAAKYIGKSDAATAKLRKQQDKAAKEAKSAGVTNYSADGGEGDYKPPSFFTPAFWIPLPFQMQRESGVSRNPAYAMPTPYVFYTNKWDYAPDGIYWSQVYMATYPWVLYDRKPIMLFTSWMVISNTTGLYRYYTNAYTIERGQYAAIRRKKPVLWFILKGSNATFKGVEVFTGWNQSMATKQAKSLFTVRAVVDRPAEDPFTKAFFIKQSPEVGYLAYARGMVYNAGEFPDPSGGGLFSLIFGSTFSSFTDGFNPPKQGGVPYDTLNWEDPADSCNARRWAGCCKYAAAFWPLGFADATLLDGCPKIKLRWEAKMCPVEMSMTDVIMARVMFPKSLTTPMARAFPLPKGFNIDPKNIGDVTDQMKSVKDILENH